MRFVVLRGFIAFLIFHTLLTGVASGVIIECRMLKNKDTGQIIIIYGDLHLEDEIEKQQNGLIINNIENVLENNIETAILFEGHGCDDFLRQKQKQFKTNPLWVVKDYVDELEYDKWNSAVKLINIDNREHVYNPVGYYLRSFGICESYKYYSEEVSQQCNSHLQEIREHPELKLLKDLSKYELDLLFYKDFMEVFYKFKSAVNHVVDKLDVRTRSFFESQIVQMEIILTSHKINSWKTKIGEFFNISFLTQRNLDLVKNMDSDSMYLQDLNTMLYILSHPSTDKFIIFVGAGHAQDLSTLLSAHSSYEKLCHRKLDVFFKGNNLQIKGDGIESLKNIPKHEYIKFNECFDLMANSFGDQCHTYAQKEFNKLKSSIRQKKESPNQMLSKWYGYRLEDMLEEMEKERLENVDSDLLEKYKKRLAHLEKDFSIKYRSDTLYSPLISSFEQNSIYGAYLNTSNIGICPNTDLPQIGMG